MEHRDWFRLGFGESNDARRYSDPQSYFWGRHPLSGALHAGLLLEHGGSAAVDGASAPCFLDHASRVVCDPNVYHVPATDRHGIRRGPVSPEPDTHTVQG